MNALQKANGDSYSDDPGADHNKQAVALGSLVTPEVSPAVRGDIVVHGNDQEQWARPETGLSTELAVVHLGRKVDSTGWNAGFQDMFETPVPDAGIAFGVYQTSYGGTGIKAKALKGYRVEAAEIDPETQQVTWQQPVRDLDDQVTVASDRGNLSDSSLFDEKWGQGNTGNPGTRAGIVRVTGPDAQVKYFALGANFEGEPDDWQVAGGIIEVKPHQTKSLPGSQAELPSGE